MRGWKLAGAFAYIIMTTPNAGPLSAQASEEGAAPTGWQDNQAPGFYRFRLGAFKVTVLSDGTAPRDLPGIMSAPEEVREAYAQSHLKLPVHLSINCYLVDTGEHRILVDTGAGELFGGTSGMLVANLKAAGYNAGDIDVILLTHIHGDHSGGLSIKGSPVFSNAMVYVDKRDPEHWLSREEEAKVPADRKSTFEQSHQTVDPVIQAGKLKTFDGASSLFEGVTAVPERGHTPGMTGYMFESESERLYVWGDIIHSTEVQFADPSVTIAYDVNAEEAADTRRDVLARAAEEGFMVGGAHISFPGVGRVRKVGNTYAWVPEPYMAKP